MSEPPLVSVIVPTLVRTSLYPLLEALLEQEVSFPYEVILVAQAQVDGDATTDMRIRVHYEEPGQGFSHYRNVGVDLARGEILAFIDDDEIPQDRHWLATQTAPVRQGDESVVTAGVSIPLGNGYLTDSISLLGFPGGGAIGYEHMWPVTGSRTDHVCSGNFAIRADILSEVGGFAKEAKYGNEDIALARELVGRGIPILYLPEATVLHEACSGLGDFIRWNIRRGISARIYLRVRQHDEKVWERFQSSARILKIVSTKYSRLLPGVIFAMTNQYAWQVIGALWGHRKSA